MKKTLYLSIIAGLLAAGCSNVTTPYQGYSYKNVKELTFPDESVPDHSSEPHVLYHDAQYNFTFSMPISWKGYTVLIQQWNGQAYLPGGGKEGENEQGPEIVLRHPQWKADDPWQDIPILVFTRKQWNAARHGRFALDADGFEYEIAHNSKYVFAIWSLFNWDENVKGAREAEGIVMRNRAANTPHLYPDNTK